jgi:outer membrane usher protein
MTDAELASCKGSSPRRRAAYKCGVAVVLGCSLHAREARADIAFVGTPQSAPTTAADVSRIVRVDVRLNDRELGTWPILQRDKELYVAVEDLEVWRVKRRPNVPLHEENGRSWYPLHVLRGTEVRFAISDRRLEIHVPPSDLLPGSLPPLTAASRASSPVLTAPTAAAAPPPGSGSATNAPVRYLPLDVTVNGSRAGNWLLLESRGALYASEDAFREWRVSIGADAKPIEVRGQVWYPLSSVPGFTSQIDFATESIQIRFSPEAFAATRLTEAPPPRIALTPSIPAAFLNYDLNYQTQSGEGLGTTRDLGALLELGFSNAWGVLTSSYSGTGLLHTDPLAGSMWRRLEITYSRDFPQRDISVRVGDSSTRQGIGGRSVYFGGLQIGRDFGLTPGFIAQPTPVIAGVSTAPSTVELYVNDALRQTSRVPAGPFAIDNFPLLTGSGEARIVVRDLLGRETVLVQDFFTHRSLLAPGLSDWSWEFGALRRNLGTLNADYGPHFTSGLYRYGIDDHMTVEGRAEVTSQTKVVAAAANRALPLLMLGQLSIAASRDAVAGAGAMASAGLERRTLRHSFTLYLERTSDTYRQLGQDATSFATRSQQSASYNYSHPTLGNVGFALARLVRRDSERITTTSVNYSRKIGNGSSIALSLTRAFGPEPGTAVGVSLIVPLGKNFTSSSSVTHRNGLTEAYTSVSKGLTQETGVGYRALAGTRQNQAYSEGGVYYQGGKTMLTADVSASSALQTLRLGASGGLAATEGRFFTARHIDGSFAVVEVPGYPGVGVGFQGSSLTKTDASGIAILPRLNPYVPNSIRLDPRELPISAELDSIEQIAVPAARSAVKVVFPVRSGRAALVKLLLDDGGPAPAGATIELVGDKHEFFVARRGEAFITGLKDENQIRLKYGEQTCSVDIHLPPPSPDDIVRIGPLTCAGVKR